MNLNLAKNPRSSRAKPVPAKVLFVCVGNACRSAMAEAISYQEAGDIIEASSAGLLPLGFIPEMTKQTLATNGYAHERLASKPITREAWDAAEIVINMSGQPRELTFQVHDKVEDWLVKDPYGGDAQLYQAICEEIQTCVRELAERLRTEQKR
ncbi:MAG TPA: low molecular weight phosphatase family protein [Candidatus Dormibacteraeota bacterium]|nr:low molecular weight phosphatase family protein [Candidatus Dormibacteraeota bacterium]